MELVSLSSKLGPPVDSLLERFIDDHKVLEGVEVLRVLPADTLFYSFFFT